MGALQGAQKNIVFVQHIVFGRLARRPKGSQGILLNYPAKLAVSGECCTDLEAWRDLVGSLYYWLQPSKFLARFWSPCKAPEGIVKVPSTIALMEFQDLGPFAAYVSSGFMTKLDALQDAQKMPVRMMQITSNILQWHEPIGSLASSPTHAYTCI